MSADERTAPEILDQTNELAYELYRIRGYTVHRGYRFDLASHPHEQEAWWGACVAQSMLRNEDLIICQNYVGCGLAV